MSNAALKVSGSALLSPPVRRRPKIMTGLVGLGSLCGSLAQARRNLLSRTAASATVGGTPVIDAHGADCSGSAHFTFDAITQPQDLTLIIVANGIGAMSSTGTRPVFGGWFSNSSTPKGAAIYVGSPSQITATAEFSEGGVATTRTAIIGAYTVGSGLASTDLQMPRILVLTIAQGVGISIYDKTRGVISTAPNSNSCVPPVGRGLRLGGAYAITGLAGPSRIYEWEAHNVAMSEAQIDALVVAIRKRMLDKHGINV